MGVGKVTREEIFYKLLSIVESMSVIGKEIIADIKISDLKNEVRLVDIGVNSIDYVEVVTSMMEIQNLTIPIDKFVNVNTIHDVVEIIYDQTSIQNSE